MKSNKTIQKKFRIDRNTEKALKKILSNNKITFQFIMEFLLREYICKNIEAVINNDKWWNLMADIFLQMRYNLDERRSKWKK